MRRYLEALLTMGAITTGGTLLFSAGCLPQSGGATATSAGGSGPTESTGPSTSTDSGAGGSSGAGDAKEVSEVIPSLVDPTPKASCIKQDELSPATFLSVPRARSMASAAQVRGILLGPEPATPPPSLVRPDEVFNYYHVTYPTTPKESLTIVTELAATAVPGDYLLQIGVQSATVVDRRPTSLTVLIDSSSSMTGEAMKRANAALHALAASLNKGDVLTYLTTDAALAPVHRVAQKSGDPALFQLADELQVSGMDSLQLGVDRAYEQARSGDSYRQEGINRVVVITDGGSPVEAINGDAPQAYWKEQGIELVGVGVGSAAGYHEELLSAATTAGHGANLYLDSVDEAENLLHRRFDEVMDEAAGDVSIAFRLPWIFQQVTSGVTEAGFSEMMLTRSDLGRGLSMVFRHTVSVCGKMPLDTDLDLDLPIEVTASWSERGKPERQMQTQATPLKEALHEHPSRQVLKATALVAFGNALRSLDASRFKDACTKLLAARAGVATPNEPDAKDPELDAILKQLNAHPVVLADKGLHCD